MARSESQTFGCLVLMLSMRVCRERGILLHQVQLCLCQRAARNPEVRMVLHASAPFTDTRPQGGLLACREHYVTNMDDLSNRGQQDSSCVNLNEVHGLRYWTGRFGVTAAELHSAVEAAGSQAEAVEAYLKDATVSSNTRGPKIPLRQFHDPLTGLLSRQSFLLALELAVSDAQGSTESLSVLVVEASHAVSDEPSDGDAILAKLGKLLKLAAGPSGVLGRFDGKQVAVMLRHSNISVAHVTAAELCTAAALYFEAYREHVTLSVGAACGPSNTDWAGHDLLHLAGWRCIQASQTGGYSVHSAGFPDSESHFDANWPSSRQC